MAWIRGEIPFSFVFYSFLYIPYALRSRFRDIVLYREEIESTYTIAIPDLYHAKDFLKKDSIIIDAGANVGVFSRFAAGLSPEGRVYAFEPAPTTFDYLARRSKDFKNIIPVNAALGATERKGKILVSKIFSGGSRMTDSPYKMKGDQFVADASFSIDVIPIDAFVKQQGIPRVDFIKIDAEGYEKEILEGAAETIKRFKPIIVMGAYHVPGDIENLPKVLGEGYRCTLNPKGREDLLCVPK